MNTVCPPPRRKYAPKPFHKAPTPSSDAIFIKVWPVDRYAKAPPGVLGAAWDCMRVLAVSKGKEAREYTKPAVREEIKCRLVPSGSPISLNVTLAWSYVPNCVVDTTIARITVGPAPRQYVSTPSSLATRSNASPT